MKFCTLLWKKTATQKIFCIAVISKMHSKLLCDTRKIIPWAPFFHCIFYPQSNLKLTLPPTLLKKYIFGTPPPPPPWNVDLYPTTGPFLNDIILTLPLPLPFPPSRSNRATRAHDQMVQRWEGTKELSQVQHLLRQGQVLPEDQQGLGEGRWAV